MYPTNSANQFSEDPEDPLASWSGPEVLGTNATSPGAGSRDSAESVSSADSAVSPDDYDEIRDLMQSGGTDYSPFSRDESGNVVVDERRFYNPDPFELDLGDVVLSSTPKW